MKDKRTSTLTLLKAETGDVVTTRQLLIKGGQRGVTTDTMGNAYVCNRIERTKMALGARFFVLFIIN